MSPAIFTALAEIEGWVGRSGREKDTIRRSEWAAILLPHDPLAQAMHYLEARGAKIPTSTCALVGTRFLALVGCRCSESSRPYLPRVGQAVADVERIARRHGAWRTSTEALATYPQPGDLLCMRPESPHVAVVTGSRAEDGAILSIDGGSRDNTWTDRRARRLQADGTVVDLDDGISPTPGRISRLYARVSGEAVAMSLDACR